MQGRLYHGHLERVTAWLICGAVEVETLLALVIPQRIGQGFPLRVVLGRRRPHDFLRMLTLDPRRSADIASDAVVDAAAVAAGSDRICAVVYHVWPRFLRSVGCSN